MHVTGLPPYWPALRAVLLLGAEAQVVRMRSASPLPGVVMHAAYNACAVLAVFAHG